MSRQLEIGPIFIIAGREQDYSIDGFGGGYGSPPVPGWTTSINGEVVRRADKFLFDGRTAADKEYAETANAMPMKLEADLSRIATDADASGITVLDKLAIESKILNDLIAQKAAAYQAQFSIAQSYDGADPTTAFRMPPGSYPPQYYYKFAVDWVRSYKAGLNAKLLNSEAKILNDRKSKVNAEVVDIQGATKFTVEFYKEVGSKFGDRLSALAQQLANDAQGKTIRNAGDAMKVFEKYKDGFNARLGVKDREAIKKALDSLDVAQLARNVKIFSKGFGYVGIGIDAADLLLEVKSGFATGKWNGTFLKVEALFAGAVAAGLIAFAFGVSLTAPISIIAFALIMALVGSFINEERVQMFNDALVLAVDL